MHIYFIHKLLLKKYLLGVPEKSRLTCFALQTDKRLKQNCLSCTQTAQPHLFRGTHCTIYTKKNHNAVQYGTIKVVPLR